MIKKLTLIAGFGAGYVLGAKAGTGRYDQIVAKANELIGRPAVQQAASTVQSKAGDLADKAVETVNGAVGSVTRTTSTTPATVDLDAVAPRPGAAASVTAPDVTPR